jgi:hypothetical protein
LRSAAARASSAWSSNRPSQITAAMETLITGNLRRCP